MLRQVLSTSSRALRSHSRSFASRPTIKPQLSHPPPPLLRPALLAPRVRWYSEQTDSTAAKKEGETPPAEPAQTNGEGDVAAAAKPSDNAEAELKKKLQAKEREVIDWKDKYLRSVADFRNLQDRTQRDMKAARDFAIQKFAKDLVDSVDNLDRALIMGEEKLKPAAATVAAAAEGQTEGQGQGEAASEEADVNQDLKAFYEGVKMTETNMLQTLRKHGLERFDPQGDKFNPNEHEATFMIPMPGQEDNTVFHVQQKGFKLNGRILRAAKVGVVKNSTDSAQS